MRIGIFSDVHANIEAMTAVVDAFKSERIDKYVCIGDVVGYGASPNECCDLDPQDRGVHDPRQPRRRGRRPDGLLVLLRRRPPGARPPRAPAHAREHGSGCENLPYEVREGDVTFCHGSPINLEEFEYIFSVEQATRCLDIWDDLGTRHVHRPLAPVQVVRADARRGVRGRRDEVRDPARAPLHHLGRLGRPAARLRQPRELHDLRHRRARRSSSSASRTTSTRAAQKIFAAELERNFGNRLFLGV